MTTGETPYSWTRRDDESNPAYEAFRVYLDARSTTKVAEQLGKSVTLITRWCHEKDWVERVKAYDVYTMTAETDGLANAIAESRDKNLALVDKLRGHLDSRLDDFIAQRQDPTVRWTQALTAMAKVEQNCFMLKDDQKTTDKLERVEGLIDRLMSERDTV